ncbi:HD domain-containing phosphohydrolase [Pseudodesulfovibrio sp.]|uniref:HD domain-containing phosphohydrolase n=1 Tax=Pseudodesulfovibrio sp. TaxID=2035812 RepID=UPI0026342E2A|nr:HD domain-containing phosphohydrolase [Pseudodesulfovibrio sp.]MDD3310792.1 HD domain-containing protein [Pseudodesulfovibrio sp.]
MTPLKKFIRPKVLSNFLNKAVHLADCACALAIAYEGEVLMVEGPASFDGFGAEREDVIGAPLRFDALHRGQLLLRLNDPADRERCERLLAFAVYSLQELLDMEQARRSIADEALSKYRELALLHRSVPAINTSLRMRDVVGALINECRRENYPGEYGMIFLSEPGSSQFRLAVQFGFPFGSNLQPVAESLLFRDVVGSGKGEIVNNLRADERWKGELAGLGSMALIPIASPNRCEGMLLLASHNEGLFEAAHSKSLSTLASVAGISVSNAFNFEGVQTLMNAILRALAEAIDSRDPFTAGHSERVAHLVVAFASLLGGDPGFPDLRFSDQDLRELFYSGILHDVGKIGIKEDVLTKKTRLPKRRMEVIRARFRLLGQTSDFDWREAFERVRSVNRAMAPDKAELDYVRELGGRVWKTGDDVFPLLYDDELEVLLLDYGNLTPDERKEIQRHPAESERILQHIPMLEGFTNMLSIIRQHHERMDGSGYPDGLRGDAILPQSRLMAIVDIYDAVTQERHYKPAFTRSEAMNILSREAAEGKLDSHLVHFFMEHVERVESLSERVRSTRVNHLSEIGNLAGL